MGRDNRGNRKRINQHGTPQKVQNHYRPQACGKICFPSKTQARRKMDEIRKDPKSNSTLNLVAYHCELCQAYHLGHRVPGMGTQDMTAERQSLGLATPREWRPLAAMRRGDTFRLVRTGVVYRFLKVDDGECRAVDGETGEECWIKISGRKVFYMGSESESE